MRYFLIAVLAVFVVGCVPFSDNPLTDANKEEIDSSILGTWIWKDGNESGFIHIGLDEKNKLLRLIMVDFNRHEEIAASMFSGHTSLLRGKKYLNLKWIYPPHDETPGYLFVKYVVSADSLGIALMDNEVVEKAIAGGSLKGNVKKEKWSFSVHITEAQKALQGFINERDKDLFPEMKFLQRLKP